MVKARNYLGLAVAPDQIESTPVSFGEWLPDMPEIDNPGAVEALNVIPSEGGYIPFNDVSAIAGLTLPAAPRGAITLFGKSGSPFLYAATTTDIYRRVGSSFVSMYTTSAPLYSAYQWQFVPFGWSVVALHPQLQPLVADVGGGSVFSPLAGSPPIARCGSRIGNFLVLGNLQDFQDPDSIDQPSRVRWSGYNNIESEWVTDPATQADFNDMPSDGGPVVAITGREYGSIFQARSISRMSYVGLPNVFDIQTVEEQRGAIATGCVVDIGAFVFFIADDGFYVWNGTNAEPVGDNKVNRYFFGRLNYSARDRIVGAVDYVNKCIVWAFPVGNGKTLDELIIYSYKENRFSHAVATYDYIMPSFSLDASLDDMVGSIDAMGLSWDDESYTGRKPGLAGFTTGHAYGPFSGSSLAATLDTAEYTAPGGKRVFVNGVRPNVDVSAAVATVQVAKRDQLAGEALVFGAAVAQEITGECPVIDDARFMRFRTNIPAGATWLHARGVDIWRKSTGRR